MVECYTAKALLDIGMNLIMDTLFLKDEKIGLKEWVELLHDYHYNYRISLRRYHNNITK